MRPWGASDAYTPRAHGDYVACTATSYGLMLAYNQLSGNAGLRNLGTGGGGRKGAQRLVILETDGMANQATSAGFTNAGPYDSFYSVAPGDGGKDARRLRRAVRRRRAGRSPCLRPQPGRARSLGSRARSSVWRPYLDYRMFALAAETVEGLLARRPHSLLTEPAPDTDAAKRLLSVCAHACA